MPGQKHSTSAIALLTGITAVGFLAGCTPATNTEPAPTQSSPAEPGPVESGGSGSGAYIDGTYSTDANYQSPNGTESIEVTITLDGDNVSAVEVVGFGESPNSKRYQAQFIDNIGALVVGKKIDDLEVSKVAGSSLTSGGFNDAVETIKAEALR